MLLDFASISAGTLRLREIGGESAEEVFVCHTPAPMVRA